MIFGKRKLLSILFFVVSEILYSFELTYLKLPELIYKTLLFFIFAICFFLIFDRWKAKELVISCIIISIAICVYISSTESLYLILFFTIFAMRNISYTEAAKVMFFTRLLMTSMVIVLSLIGVISINKMNVAKGIYGFAIGYGLGYIHPNDLAQAIVILCMLYFCMRVFTVTQIEILIIMAVDGITYMITMSKTACIILLSVCIVLFVKDKKVIKHCVNKFSMIYVLFIAVISTVIPMLYSYSSGTLQKIMYYLNGHLNGRFSNASIFFLNFPLTLFGKVVDLTYLSSKYGYSTVDNGYVFLLFDYGIVGFLTILFLYLYAIKKLAKRNMTVFIVIICAFLTLGMMENVIRAMYMNFTMIFWYEILNYRTVSNDIDNMEE